MKKIIFLILFILLCNNCFSVIWYVSEGGRGNNDGTSWSNAAADFPDLFQNQIDMGAYEYQELLNYAPSNQNIFDNNNSIIDYDKLIIFDLTGRIIAELSNINDIYSLVLTNGIYFISYYKDDILKFSNKFIINN